MQHSDFRIGETFWCSGRQWRCTDTGMRTIVAIRIDQVEVGSSDPVQRRTLGRAEAEAEGWFSGPPYAVSEVVFDEDYMPACSREPDAATPADSAAPRSPAEAAARMRRSRQGNERLDDITLGDLKREGRA